MSTPPPNGVYVPAVVFFNEKDELDIPSIQQHVLRLAQGGVTGILAQGSNGEAQHLSHKEREQVISVTRSTLNENGYKNVLVIAGTGTPSAQETIQLCREAQQAGASHALVLTPSIWPKAMTRENIIRFHRQVADASPIPTMIYNFPTVTAGIDLDSDIIGTLAAHPNIVGTKLSCGNIGKLHRLTTHVHSSSEKFAVYPGRSDTYLFGLLGGGSGVIAALVNLFPKLHVQLYEHFREGRITEAVELQALLSQADWAVSQIGGIGGLKTLIKNYFEYGNPAVRSPLQPVSFTSSNPHYILLSQLAGKEKAL